METTKSEILDSDSTFKEPIKRRNLLPWWIKTFAWIFMIFGAIAPFGLILGVFKFKFQLSLYGLETTQPISVIGISLILIFLFKGISAFGLWTEKDWAIKVGTLDAILGLIICVFVIVYTIIDNEPSNQFSFRFEIIFLILYLRKLRIIKNSWEKQLSCPEIGLHKAN